VVSSCRRWRGGSVQRSPWHAYRAAPSPRERGQEGRLDRVKLTMPAEGGFPKRLPHAGPEVRIHLPPAESLVRTLTSNPPRTSAHRRVFAADASYPKSQERIRARMGRHRARLPQPRSWATDHVLPHRWTRKGTNIRRPCLPLSVSLPTTIEPTTPKFSHLLNEAPVRHARNSD
jgi:hypothetical protein